MVGGIQQQQHYPNSNPLHKPEQQLNLGPQTYSVHSKGMQDPRQQKLLMDQQQPRVAHNSPYIKQVRCFCSTGMDFCVYLFMYFLGSIVLDLGKPSPGVSISSRQKNGMNDDVLSALQLILIHCDCATQIKSDKIMCWTLLQTLLLSFILHRNLFSLSS